MRTLIAVPCMDTMPTRFVSSFVNLRRVGETHYAFNANSLIYDSRNIFAAKAITDGYDRVLWLDSDMVFDPDMMERLMADMDAGDLDYVSGLFFRRRTPTSPVLYRSIEWQQTDDGLKSGAVPYRDYPADQLFEVGGSGIAAVLTSTRLLKAVWEAYGPPFNPLVQLGEDLSFCWRAKQLGYRLYCDSRIKVGLVGPTVYDETTYLMQAKRYVPEAIGTSNVVPEAVPADHSGAAESQQRGYGLSSQDSQD